jgi:hypothetical protein
VADLPEYEPLRVYVDATGAQDVANVATDWRKAVALVGKFLAEWDKEPGDVDPDVLEGAIVDCGSEIYHRRDAPFGVTAFATPDGPVGTRVSTDPMIRARVMLAPYVDGLGFSR